MSDKIRARELLAIRTRTARAEDGLHQSLRQTETDREALLREVYRLRDLDTAVAHLEATIARVRADCEEQRPGDTSDTSSKMWEFGVYAQACRTLRILAAEATDHDPLHTAVEAVLLDHADQLAGDHTDANLADLAYVYEQRTGWTVDRETGGTPETQEGS